MTNLTQQLPIHIHINLMKCYFVTITEGEEVADVIISSRKKLLELLESFEIINSIGFEFKTHDGAYDRMMKSYKRTLDKVCAVTGMEIGFIDNEEIKGHIFPHYHIGALLPK